jgi:hypothetical protein
MSGFLKEEFPMSASGRSRQPPLDHPTRQQLDELDALMQRMLALPVNPLEDAAASNSPPPLGNSLPAQPAAAPSQEMEALPSTAPSAVVAQPAEASAASSSVLEQSLRSRPPTTAPSEKSDREPFRLSSRVLLTSSAASLPNEKVLVAHWLLPLYWTNQAFDRATRWFGPLGRWLRGPSGRSLLGWGGLLLLAAALAWLAAEGLDWTW